MATTDSDRRVAASSDRFELMVAVVIGVAALMTAYATLKSSLLSDNVLQGFTDSTQAYNDAIALENDETQTYLHSQNLFLRYAEARQSGDDELADYLRDSLFEPELEAAVAWWEGAQGAAKAPTSPFDEGSPFTSPLRADIDRLTAAGDASFDDAKRADQTGDYFDISAAVLAITLFAGGLASVTRSVPSQRVLVALAWLGLVAGGVYLARGQFS